MKRWQHCLCLLALVCALQTALVVAVMPQTEQDALTTIASTFPILVSGHNWNTTSASTACSAPWYGLTCSGDNVQSIILNGIALNGEIPQDMTPFTALSTLTLSACGLAGSLPTLPSTIAHLDLSDNDLDGTISSLASLSALTYIDLSQNQFSGSLPSFAAATSLATLQIDTNKLNLCGGSDPAISSSLTTCSVEGQTGFTSCSCTAYFPSPCTQDTCSTPTAPTTTPTTPSTPPTAPTVPPTAPQAPTTPPTAPQAPTTPPTAPQAAPAPTVTPVEPTTPPTEPVATPAPETTPQAPHAAPTAPQAAPTASPQASGPSAPTAAPVDAPQSSPAEVVPTVASPILDSPTATPIDISDVPPGSIVPIGICADATYLTLTPPYPVQFLFSYKSNLTGPVSIPVGDLNRVYADISDAATPVGQPTIFYPGTHYMVMRVNGYATAPVRWSLANYTATINMPTDQSTICPRTPLWTTLELSDASASAAQVSSNLESYICTLLNSDPTGVPVNCTVPGRVVVETDALKRATLVANVTLAADAFFSITGYGMMQRFLANISTPESQASFAETVAPGSSLAAISPDASVPQIDAVYSATPGSVNAPYFGPRTPYTYYRLTGAQIAGVVIAVVCGVALLIAVAIGLWYASKPARTTSSAHSGGIASSARSDSTNGNTTRDADPADEGSTDDEEDDDEDDSASPSSVEESEANEESEEEEEEDEESSEEEESSEASEDSESSEASSSEESS